MKKLAKITFFGVIVGVGLLNLPSTAARTPNSCTTAANNACYSQCNQTGLGGTGCLDECDLKNCPTK